MKQNGLKSSECSSSNHRRTYPFWMNENTSGVIPEFGYGAASMTTILRNREVGNHFVQGGSGLAGELCGHGSLIRRLECRHVLKKHEGCVNTLCWNSAGSLLASGSDDCRLVIWDYATAKAKTTIETGHRSNIFAVTFVPGTNDQVLASGAMDFDVRVHHGPEYQSASLYNVHRGRVKDVRSSPAVPNVFWSAGEDGRIAQFDLRNMPTQGNEDSDDVMPLRPVSSDFQESSGELIRIGKGILRGGQKGIIGAMGISVHPLDSHKMAVACGDNYMRIYDRRMLRRDEEECTKPVMLLTPSHLKQDKYHGSDYHGTSVHYNRNGSELLVTYHGDHIYLFNTDEVHAKDGETSIGPECQPKMSFNHAYQNRNYPPVDCKGLTLEGDGATKSKEYSFAIECYTAAIEHMDRYASCSRISKDEKTNLKGKLYTCRAWAYVTRDWRGDAMLAIDDANVAIEIQPENPKAIVTIVTALRNMEKVKEAERVADDGVSRFPMLSKELKPFVSRAFYKAHYEEAHLEDDDSNDGEDDHSTDDDEDERELSSYLSEYSQRITSTHVIRRYEGYCNIQTDIKEARFFGPNDTHIVTGSDDGCAWIWEKSTGKAVTALKADEDIVNCVQPHPFDPCLATSGIESVIRLWEPTSFKSTAPGREALAKSARENQTRIAEPFSLMQASVLRQLLDSGGGGEHIPNCTQS